MSNFLGLLVVFFKNLPEIFSIVKQVIKAWQSLADSIERKRKTEQIKDAINTSKETKDTSKLESVFGIKFVVEDKEKPEEKKSLEIDLSQKKKSIFDFIFPKAQASVSSMGFGSNMGSVGITTTFYNVSNLSGSSRISSKFLSIALLLMSIGCAKGAINQPDFKPKIWAGDSKNVGITRAQDQKTIPASSPEFDDYVAVSYRDFGCLMKTYVINCAEYREAVVSCDDLSSEKVVKYIKKHNLDKEN